MQTNTQYGSPPPYQGHLYQTSQPAESTPPLEAEDLKQISATLDWIPSSPSPAHPHPRRLLQPVAVPQIAPATFISGPQPFTRAYAPILAQYAISPTTFAAFIDGLTIAQAPTAPLQAMQVVGTGIGVVPHHWAQLASAGIGAAAGVGTAAVSAARTKKYLADVNSRFFQGRGLRARIVGDDELGAEVLGLRGHEPGMSLAEVDLGSGVVTLPERRLAALQGRVAQLTLDVPPPTRAEGMLDRMSAWQVAAKGKRGREKAEKKAAKKADGKDSKRHGGKKERERREKEVKSIKKLKWLIVENLDAARRVDDAYW